jgi:putative ABC transport system permease protein
LRLTSTIEGAAVALKANAMRSVLTALGLIIGIASVVVMMAFGNGLQGLVLRQIASFDRTLTMVLPQSQGASGQIAGQPGFLRDRDLLAIERSVAGVELAGGQVRRAGRISAEGRSWTTQLTGADAGTLQMLNLHVVSGRTFTMREHDSAARAAIIGDTVKRRLFGAGEMPDDAKVRLNGSPVTVVGVVRAAGAGLGMDQDDVLYVPLSTARRRLAVGAGNALPFDALQSIWITFRSESAARDAQVALKTIFDKRYALRGSDLRSYSIVSMREQLQKSRKAVAAFSIALAGIASISLLVGGIGIMNMMLVSVTERTGEIGLRMAVGASPTDVTGQFLTESLMLCLMGGCIGVGIGVGVAELLRYRMPDWPIATDASSILLAAVVSCAVGMFFGIAPAVKASRMSPVEALKRG